ncbi:hypothetical protein [Pontixanthobacter aquaemixtae]|uniref:Uncharacterized protein n=1 Tax=Pontixanthobacter aquaemixtae TaxID=1958940 RepID=A0A844ZPJ3_9SPHN|nr:hypothetical protein [Pontixanthobacter aquaemixtae]MXO89474.1 hypothetical protein [Pontixanthobacter aquaemixtae]
MKNLAVFLGCAAASAMAYPVFAQDAASQVEEAVETAVEEVATEAVQVAEEAAEAPCELHVFPTTEGQAQNFGLFGPGLINSAINADNNVSNAEYMREALSPRFQVEAFRSIDVAASVGMPDGTEVVYQTPISDRDITTKVKTRLSDSEHECYAELIVTQNLYQKKMIYGRSLNNRFIFKDFRGGIEKANMVKGRGGNGLSHFPPDTVEDRPAADADLRKAFLANFDEYSKRFR